MLASNIISSLLNRDFSCIIEIFPTPQGLHGVGVNGVRNLQMAFYLANRGILKQYHATCRTPQNFWGEINSAPFLNFIKLISWEEDKFLNNFFSHRQYSIP